MRNGRRTVLPQTAQTGPIPQRLVQNDEGKVRGIVANLQQASGVPLNGLWCVGDGHDEYWKYKMGSP